MDKVFGIKFNKSTSKRPNKGKKYIKEIHIMKLHFS